MRFFWLLSSLLIAVVIVPLSAGGEVSETGHAMIGIEAQGRAWYTLDREEFGPWFETSLGFVRAIPSRKDYCRIAYCVKQYTTRSLGGLKLELESWPVIDSRNYLNIIAAISSYHLSDTVYPQFSVAGEWYWSGVPPFEISGGGRVVGYGGPIIWSAIASISLYRFSHYFLLRGEVLVRRLDAGFNTALKVRRYFSDEMRFIGLNVGIGASPGGAGYRNGNGEVELVNRFGTTLRIGVSAAYLLEEYGSSQWSGRVSTGCIMEKLW